MGRVVKPKIAVQRAKQAKSHGVNTRQGIVLHSTESHDRPGLSDINGIISYLNGKGYGIHYVVDGSGNIGQGAYHRNLVYHCKGANATHIGIEMIGQAKWTTKQWLWNPIGSGKRQRKQLAAVAHLIAYICDREAIPIRLNADYGVSRHSDHPAGGHWDPGPGFPIGYVLKRAAKIRAAARAR